MCGFAALHPKDVDRKREHKNQKGTAMSDNKTERKKPLHDWSFMVNPNPPAGVREKTLRYFRDNPVSVTIRPARALRPSAKRRKEDE
jgi:hypothetical protein